MPTCKGCGQEIKWVKTFAGRNMPLDPKPVKMVQVKDRPVMDGVQVESVKTGYMIDVYMPHWATCPKAENFKPNKEKQHHAG